MCRARPRFQLLGSFRNDLGAQLHAAARLATVPALRIVAGLPERGLILDVGCGHGVLGLLAAIEHPLCTVVGVDIDSQKLQHARRAAANLGLDDRITFVHVEPNHADPVGIAAAGVERECADAVLCVDVLYLLDQRELRTAIADMADATAPGGRVLIKEMAATPRWKVRLAALQEIAAVRLFRWTMGGPPRIVDPRSVRSAMEDRGLRVSEARLDQCAPHPHLMLTGQKGLRPGRAASETSKPANTTMEKRSG